MPFSCAIISHGTIAILSCDIFDESALVEMVLINDFNSNPLRSKQVHPISPSRNEIEFRFTKQNFIFTKRYLVYRIARYY